MKMRGILALFAMSSCAWVLLTLALAPSMNGNDVFIFRDAGWNLATSGHFESSALIYMRDLTPRFFAHYTPIFPLLFAGFLKIFPQNAYAGTVFNLLAGFFMAAVSLFIILKQQASTLRTLILVIIALAPVLFVTYDRPEALGLSLFALTLSSVNRIRINAPVAGSLLALTFLAHPLMAILAAVWIAIGIYLNVEPRSSRLRLTAIWSVRIAVIAALIIAAVALLDYTLDSSSIQRFLGHALGYRSGLGVMANKGTFLANLKSAAFGHGRPFMILYLLTLFLNGLLVIWFLWRRRLLSTAEQILVTTTLLLTVATVLGFPAEGHYIIALGFLIPTPLLLFSVEGSRLKKVAMISLTVVLLAHLPETALHFLERAEELPGYHAALPQPGRLLSKLSSPEAIVAVEGGSYDLYKPYFHRLVELDHADDVADLSGVEGLANCYGGFDGNASTLRPLPAVLNPAGFQLIERAPSHLWVTAFGHRIMSRQWGYGCDLYLRFKNQKPALSAEANVTQAR
jgi:hypothetical protein